MPLIVPVSTNKGIGQPQLKGKHLRHITWMTAFAVATIGVSASADTLELTRQAAEDADSVPAEEEKGMASWFFSLNVGANIALDAEIKDISPTTTAFGLQNSKIKFEPGAQLDFAFAWPITTFFSMDVQTGIAWNDVKSFSGDLTVVGGTVDSVTGGDGSIVQFPLMTNAIFDISLSEKIFLTFNVGAGIQWSHANIDGIYLASVGPTLSASFNQGNLAFRYQAGAELRFEISNGITLGAFTRFSGTTETNFGKAEFNAFFVGTEDIKAKSLMNVAFGLNFRATF